jgi:hypothetical protein
VAVEHRLELFHALELVAEEEQVPALRPAECAGEAGKFGLDPVGDLAAVEYSNRRSRWSALVVGVAGGAAGAGNRSFAECPRFRRGRALCWSASRLALPVVGIDSRNGALLDLATAKTHVAVEVRRRRGSQARSP